MQVIARILRRPLVGNVMSLYGVQGLNYLIPLLILPYLLRTLGPKPYGSIVFAQSVMGYGVIVTEFGFNFTSTREISVSRNDPRAVAEIYWTTMAAKGLLLALSGLIIGICVVLVPAFHQAWQIFAACGLILLGNVAFPQWYFQGLERLRDVALVQAIAKCVIAASVVLFVRSPRDASIAAIILSAPQLAGAAAAIALRKPLTPAFFYRPSASEIAAALRRSAHMFGSILSTTLYLHTNTLVLGLLRGDEAVAMYNIGTRLIAAVQGMVSPISQAVFPRASILFMEQRARAWQLLKHVAALLLPVIVLISLVMGVFAAPIVHILGGQQYEQAASILRIMAPIPVLVTAAIFLSQLVMANTGLTRELLRIYVTVGLANLALLPVLVYHYSADGAALALLIAETVGPLLMLRVVWENER